MFFRNTVKKLYKKVVFARADGSPYAHYFSAADFPGMVQKPFSFGTPWGETLQGCFYYEEIRHPSRLIVFDHGLGAGHRAYMHEIKMLTAEGYLVFSYDKTGCGESGGAGMRGLSASPAELAAAITALKGISELSSYRIAVVGHSWGGYATMNITAFHPDVTHLVVLSGFVSVADMHDQLFSGFLRLFRRTLYRLEEESNPSCAPLSGTKSLADTNAKAFLIYSADDPIVKKEFHYDRLVAALAGRENIRFRLEENKFHNPNCTQDAANYLKAFSAATQKAEAKTKEEQEAFKSSYDFRRMTAQDPAVWQDIFAFLES